MTPRTALVLFATVVSPAVRADPRPSAIELDREDAPAGRVEFGFDGGAPLVGWGTSIGLGYLSPRALEIDGTKTAAVSRRETLVLGGALALGDHAVLDARLPLSRQNGVRLMATGDAQPLDRWVAGDLRIAARLHVAGLRETGVFARAALTVPTGDDRAFAGEPSSSVSIGLIGRATLPAAIVLAATAGIHIRGKEISVGDRLVGNELVGAIGVLVPLSPIEPLWFDRRDVQLTGELVGSLGDKVGGMVGPSPVEARIGLVTHPTDSLAIGVRAGAGLDDQIGSPRWRIMVEVAYQGTWQLLPHVEHADDETADDE